MLNPIFYINGKWEKKSEAQISANDAGFLLGDGLFETIRFQNKKLFLLDKHLARLNSGLKTIKINIEYSNSDLYTILNEIINKNNFENGLIRLIITRGELEGEPWKYNGPTCLYISIRPIAEKSDIPVKVVYFNESDYPIIRFTPAIKSMNYIGNMLAKKDADKYGAYEPVFINNDGFITECAIRNIFYIKNNSLITPSEDLGILPGVTRDTIMKIGADLGLEIIKTKIPQNEIQSMDEAFISSSGIGLLPCFWDGWNSEFKLTKQLQKSLFNYINENCK
ncbi:MAG: aminotransferase class IV [Candidatus Marinimicrobia bacterium]|nr:aminotransferase class IV [Candidatus Neomarinimicrobiota bacterium]